MARSAFPPLATVVQTKAETVLANPAPLGLMGFGMTTVLLNLWNAGIIPLDSPILTMGLFYGGVAQIVAGALEFRKGNTFGMTAFLSYGLFWESFALIVLFKIMGLVSFTPSSSLAAYLFMWGVFTLLMFIGTLKLNGALMFVFGSLFILFFLLAAGNAWNNSSVTTFAGYEGIICGLSAMYASIAQLLNEVYGRVVLPIFPVKH